ncbi:Transcriptional regulator, MerR family [Candidatus Sulfopaludibacter sp. SbA3]|nr:Transcriptional regulator, MerR family [Candidatus Sulfopaludibacter sp. SbA3]
MKQDIDILYQVHEFAELAGVTVRALHHYDRLGLLKPSRRSHSGYRLYSNRDLARLEQIVVLKFLGLPLKQIRDLLKRDSGLSESLRRQRHVLTGKRRQLDSAIHAIEAAEQSLKPKQEPDWNLIKKIIKEIEMQNDTEWAMKYYTPEAQAKVEERKKLWSPELQERVSQQWAGLFADIEASLGEDPASPKAQALAARWRELLAGFTGGDVEIQKGLNKMWADHDNWPQQPRQAYTIKPEIQAFIMKVMKAK